MSDKPNLVERLQRPCQCACIDSDPVIGEQCTCERRQAADALDEKDAEIERLRADSALLDALLDPANSFKAWIAIPQFNMHGRLVGSYAASTRADIDAALGDGISDEPELTLGQMMIRLPLQHRARRECTELRKDSYHLEVLLKDGVCSQDDIRAAECREAPEDE